MLLSMTGYGAGQVLHDGLHVGVEVRTVNNRYLKLHSRLPDGYAMLEPRMEEIIRKHIRRGAVQLNVDIRRAVKSEDLPINQELLTYYAMQLSQISLGASDVRPQIDLASLLALPGVIADDRRQHGDLDTEWPHVESALEAAMQDLTVMRQVEGQAMTRDLTSQLSEIHRCAEAVEELAPMVVEAYQNRLTERLNKLLAEHDIELKPTDVVREVGIFAERVDISEEIVRLRSHLDQFSNIMSRQDGGGGRKLEFFVQELLRETNTIGSKANNAEIARLVVEAKTCIERIREMVQNVE